MRACALERSWHSLLLRRVRCVQVSVFHFHFKLGVAVAVCFALADHLVEIIAFALTDDETHGDFLEGESFADAVSEVALVVVAEEVWFVDDHDDGGWARGDL